MGWSNTKASPGRASSQDYSIERLILLNKGKRTKICRKCKKRKHIDQFYLALCGKRQYPMGTCKKCYSAKYCLPSPKTRKHKLEKARIYRSQRHKILKKMLDTYKDHPCMDCRKRYPLVVMDLDHVRGNKVEPLSHLAWSGTSEENMRAELEKCEVVCSNCHRIRTFSRLRKP
jgi:hypothetical protein